MLHIVTDHYELFYLFDIFLLTVVNSSRILCPWLRHSKCNRVGLRTRLRSVIPVFVRSISLIGTRRHRARHGAALHRAMMFMYGIIRNRDGCLLATYCQSGSPKRDAKSRILSVLCSGNHTVTKERVMRDMTTVELERELQQELMTCPECLQDVHTIPAEGVPAQSLRGCPNCGAVWFMNLSSTPRYE
jgi:hypothetical protein